MIEEKVIEQNKEVNTPPVNTEPPKPASPSVDELVSQLKTANERAEKAEQLAQLERSKAEEAGEKVKGMKSKLGQYYDDRNQALQDQGAYKPLWEEANKTNQEMQVEMNNLRQEIENLKSSNEVASTRTTALAAISNLGAINAEQTLSLLQGKLQKNQEGKVVILNGGVEQDLTSYLTSLKNPGSGWEHHFKASSAAGMGAKPTPQANTSGGTDNPWKSGNLTQQLIMEGENPELAAVLKREAQ